MVGGKILVCSQGKTHSKSTDLGLAQHMLKHSNLLSITVMNGDFLVHFQEGSHPKMHLDLERTKTCKYFISHVLHPALYLCHL